MSTTQNEIKAGIDALKNGNAATARSLFDAAARAAPADVAALLGLALACRMQGDQAAKLAALDQVLALDPKNTRALLLKGDHFAGGGDRRAATAFYQTALRSRPAQVPADLAADLERARQACAEYARQYQTHLLDALGTGDLGDVSGRFARSVDMVLGKRTVYYQQPLFYYFPELPQIQFYDRAAFPWLPTLEAATAEIRAELEQVLADDDSFVPYVQGEANRPRQDRHGMLNNPNWSAYFLCKEGRIVAEHAERCPRTMEAVQDLPLSRVTNRSPGILFSQLRPGATIPPHHGFVNTRLICHLPLIVPEGCEFRVGNEIRSWREGQAWLFDDTIEHEAWNRSQRTRVILLFDIWRPELTQAERDLVCKLFAAIDSYEGQSVSWSM